MCCSDYIACISAAIWSIVQTIVHIGWCIWAKNLYECTYKLDEKSFRYFWYLTYFYTNSCVNATLDKLIYSTNYIIVWVDSRDSLTLHGNNTFAMYKHEPMIIGSNNSGNSKLKFPAESAVAERTYNIFHTFVILDSLWIITAVALLIGTIYRFKENLATIFFFPWTIVLLFLLFFDGIAAGWYGTDISYTYGLTNWFLFIGGQNQTELVEMDAKFPKADSTKPSVWMMVLFSRFFVGWFINLFFFFRIVQAAVNAVEDFDDEESFESKQFNQGNSENVNVVINQRPRKFQVRDINVNTASVRIRRWQLYYGDDDEDDEEKHQVARHYPRRKSKQKHHTQDKEHKNKDIQYCNRQNLAVIGGYEGDRSTSPSPLPACEKQFRDLFDRHRFSAFAPNDTTTGKHAGSSVPVFTDYAEINKPQMRIPKEE